MENLLKVAMAQIAPVWLDKQATLKKVEATILEAASKKAELLVFGEAFLPGYPFWLAHTEGAAWDLKVNKELHAHYARNSIQIEAGELDSVCKLAK
jgi:nitrilase